MITAILFGLVLGIILAALLTLLFGVYTIGPTERGGIDLDDALITNIDPPADVNEALAEIQRTPEVATALFTLLDLQSHVEKPRQNHPQPRRRHLVQSLIPLFTP